MINRKSHLSVSVLALMALAACGSGDGPGGFGGSPEFDAVVSPVPGASAATLSDKADITLNERKSLTSISTVGYQGGQEHGGWAGHQNTGAVIVVSDPERSAGSDMPSTTGVELWVEGDGNAGMTEYDLYRFLASSPDLSLADNVDEITLGDGGRMVVIEVRGGDRNGADRVFLPADSSDAGVGAWAETDGEESGVYAVFGRESTMEDITRQNGTARYRGLATATASMNYHASEVQEEEILLFARQGEYNGTSEGSLDFDTGAFTLDATMTNSTGNQIQMGSSGVIDANGVMRSTVIVDGLRQNGGTVSGDFEGQVFGGNGKSIGGTFAAGIGDLREGYYPDDAVGIGGMLIMSETGARIN